MKVSFKEIRIVENWTKSFICDSPLSDL